MMNDYLRLSARHMIMMIYRNAFLILHVYSFKASVPHLVMHLFISEASALDFCIHLCEAEFLQKIEDFLFTLG